VVKKVQSSSNRLLTDLNAFSPARAGEKGFIFFLGIDFSSLEFLYLYTLKAIIIPEPCDDYCHEKISPTTADCLPGFNATG
jgi:hypothetical protein